MSEHPTALLPVVEDHETKLRRLLADFEPVGWQIMRQGSPENPASWSAERRAGTQVVVRVAYDLDGLRAKLEGK